jgi:hypothetical protein
LDPVRVCFAAYFFDPSKGGGTLQYHRYLPGMQERGIVPEVFSGTPKASKIWEGDGDAPWRDLPIGAALPTANMNGATMHGLRLPDEGSRRRVEQYPDALIERCGVSERQGWRGSGSR